MKATMTKPEKLATNGPPPTEPTVTDYTVTREQTLEVQVLHQAAQLTQQAAQHAALASQQAQQALNATFTALALAQGVPDADVKHWTLNFQTNMLQRSLNT